MTVMYEYLTVAKHHSVLAGSTAELEMLDKLGIEGWELVCIRTVNSGDGLKMVDVYYFKRRKTHV